MTLKKEMERNECIMAAWSFQHSYIWLCTVDSGTAANGAFHNTVFMTISIWYKPCNILKCLLVECIDVKGLILLYFIHLFQVMSLMKFVVHIGFLWLYCQICIHQVVFPYVYMEKVTWEGTVCMVMCPGGLWEPHMDHAVQQWNSKVCPRVTPEARDWT